MAETTTLSPPTVEPAEAADGGVLRIPMITSLEEFRRWCLSDAFPERGKIDYFRGRLEIDMAAQSLGDHGEVIAEIMAVLRTFVRDGDLGSLTDHVTRVTLPTTDLSCEPDIVFVSHESFESGRVVETPKANRPETGIELVGPPDLIVEVVSDSSFDKDFRRYREAYEEAGVSEYWLVDARGEAPVFELLRLDGQRFVGASPDGENWRRSAVFAREFRLTVRPGRGGRRVWMLESQI